MQLRGAARTSCSPPSNKGSGWCRRGMISGGRMDVWSQHLWAFYWWKEKSAVWPRATFSYSHFGTLLSLLIRGNNYQSGQVIKLKHKWLHEPGWLYYKVFPGLIKEKYGSAHPRCHSAGKNEEKNVAATNSNKSMRSFKNCCFFLLHFYMSVEKKNQSVLGRGVVLCCASVTQSMMLVCLRGSAEYLCV